MLDAHALCPAGEGGSGVVTRAMRKIRRRVQRMKAAPVSPGEGGSGVASGGRKLWYHIQREEALDVASGGRRGHHVAAGGRRGPGVATGAGMLRRHAGGSSSIATGKWRKLRRRTFARRLRRHDQREERPWCRDRREDAPVLWLTGGEAPALGPVQ